MMRGRKKGEKSWKKMHKRVNSKKLKYLKREILGKMFNSKEGEIWLEAERKIKKIKVYEMGK